MELWPEYGRKQTRPRVTWLAWALLFIVLSLVVAVVGWGQEAAVATPTPAAVEQVPAPPRPVTLTLRPLGAQTIIIADPTSERARKALDEIGEALQRHGCKLEVGVTVEGNKAVAGYVRVSERAP